MNIVNLEQSKLPDTVSGTALDMMDAYVFKT